MPKRTYQPHTRHAAKTHGFRGKNATASGKKTLKARRIRGRARLTTVN